ncbi:MAG: bifunctional 4-hydroxy-2-oxoglutarate aldolase/2-dehydro-3-deoxy-phosphogluconate aldolase [Oscillospiraceae bacterium]|jgi:2-dehydro-3-deoxyphosphogluconate aldolase/(4S)-4-hydroxy-2-oxoglutarate aldolase|nr:bifunctional 4-hydroxy-2-oxoglutarate aldolase/2-dehydro-3-deoxy-phosphogluconate aldolase [Oscillospiraceae bacterium]
MQETLNRIKTCGIIPVIKIDSADDAVPLCKALAAGGLFAAEITFRTDAAEESIRRVAAELPETLLGAGTVLSTLTAEKAIAAGAKFIVSPGTNPEVVRYCIKNNIVIIPGVCTPTDIELGLSLGLTALKFFPAEAAGGLKMLKAVSAPYSQICFMPTGGIDEKNLAEYLSFKPVIACGGSWMVRDELIKNKDWAEITRLSREAAEIKNKTRNDI